MEYREFTGKTVNDAVMEAAISFGITSAEVDFYVIEKEV
jgi:spoIIIJ-associated protein